MHRQKEIIIQRFNAVKETFQEIKRQIAALLTLKTTNPADPTPPPSKKGTTGIPGIGTQHREAQAPWAGTPLTNNGVGNLYQGKSVLPKLTTANPQNMMNRKIRMPQNEYKTKIIGIWPGFLMAYEIDIHSRPSTNDWKKIEYEHGLTVTFTYDKQIFSLLKIQTSLIISQIPVQIWGLRCAHLFKGDFTHISVILY